MAIATVTSKGQVTIPKSVRNLLRLQIGDKIRFDITEDGDVLLRPLTKRVDDVFGRLHRLGQKPLSADEMDAVIRNRMKERFG